ncbi:hypothetical protein MPER_11187 [Moniliophthora perniciosa FA553]|nr:hypothetical protein MPER_11187 [Moniliophthora perniciosa FA553]
MSYIKPLNASVGPKQTKCEIRDEVEVNDPETYISTITTTRTPDVPSGGVFSVKTRTCLMWESIIERSCIEGQRTYHSELERAMRAYIKEHQSEFIPEGIELPPPTESPEVPPQPLSPTSSTQIPPTSLTPAARERERNQRAFQWAWDTFAGAANVGKNSAKGAIELIRDAWDQSETTTILYFIIVALVLSNLWTWWLSGSSGGGGSGGKAGLGKRELRELRELRKELLEREGLGLGLGLERDQEKWVQRIVGAVCEERIMRRLSV